MRLFKYYSLLTDAFKRHNNEWKKESIHRSSKITTEKPKLKKTQSISGKSMTETEMEKVAVKLLNNKDKNRNENRELFNYVTSLENTYDKNYCEYIKSTFLDTYGSEIGDSQFANNQSKYQNVSKYFHSNKDT